MRISGLILSILLIVSTSARAEITVRDVWVGLLIAGKVITKNSYYIVGSDREQALYEAQQTLFEELKEQGVICLSATVELEERIEI
jgi:hypothetical protein